MQLNCSLTTRQAANTIGVSVSTLKRMRYAGLGPAYVKVGAKTYRYLIQDIEAWLEERRKASPSAPKNGGHYV